MNSPLFLWQVLLASTVVASIVTFIGQWLLALRQARVHPLRKYEEELAQKRILACNDLLKLVLDLEAAISPIRNGTLAFELDNERRNHDYIDCHRAMRELDKLVTREELILGSSVAKAWHLYSGAYDALERAILTDPKTDWLDTLCYVTNQFVDDMRQGISESLSNAEFSILQVDEIRLQRQTGREWIRAVQEKLKGDSPFWTLDGQSESVRKRAKDCAKRRIERAERGARK